MEKIKKLVTSIFFSSNDVDMTKGMHKICEGCNTRRKKTMLVVFFSVCLL